MVQLPLYFNIIATGSYGVAMTMHNYIQFASEKIHHEMKAEHHDDKQSCWHVGISVLPRIPCACGTWLNKQIWPPLWAILTFVYIFICFSFRLSGIRPRPVLNERLCPYVYLCVRFLLVTTRSVKRNRRK